MSFDQTSGLATNLVAWWKLDEASGARISQTASYDLAESGGTVGSQTGKVGALAARVTGTQQLTVSATGNIAPASQSYTVAFWFRIATANAANLVLFDIGGTIRMEWLNSSNVWQNYVNSGSLVSELAQNVSPGGTLARDTWHFVAMVVNRGDNTLRFYRNGLYNSKSIASVGALSSSSTVRFFLNAGASNDAAIDEAGIWNRALSDAEILSIYNSGNGNTYSPNNAAISASPTEIPYRTTTAVAVNGINTAWAPGSTPFTVSGVTGASIASTVINSTTSATINVTCGDNTGTITITDTTNGNITTTVAVIVDTTAVDPWPSAPSGYVPASAGATLNGSTRSIAAKTGSNGNYQILSGPLALRKAGGANLVLRWTNTQSADLPFHRLALWAITRNALGVATAKTYVGQFAVAGSNAFTVQAGRWVDTDALDIGTITTPVEWALVAAIARPETGQPALTVDAWNYTENDADPDGTGKLYGAANATTVDLTTGGFFDGLSGGSEATLSPVIAYLQGTDTGYICFIGDSKMTQSGLVGGPIEAAMQDMAYGNAAQNGDTLGNLTSASPNRLNKARREWLKSATHTGNGYGTNDFGGALSTTTAHAANLTTACGYSPSAYNILLTISPQTSAISGGWADGNQQEKVVAGVNVSQRIDAMNTLIRANYITYGADNVLDLYSLEKADGTLLWRTGYSGDGIHEGTTLGVPVYRGLIRGKFYPLAALMTTTTSGGGSGSGEPIVTTTETTPLTATPQAIATSDCKLQLRQGRTCRIAITTSALTEAPADDGDYMELESSATLGLPVSFAVGDGATLYAWKTAAQADEAVKLTAMS